MYVRTDGFVKPKFLGCIDNQILVPMLLRYYPLPFIDGLSGHLWLYKH